MNPRGACTWFRAESSLGDTAFRRYWQRRSSILSLTAKCSTVADWKIKKQFLLFIEIPFWQCSVSKRIQRQLISSASSCCSGDIQRETCYRQFETHLPQKTNLRRNVRQELKLQPQRWKSHFIAQGLQVFVFKGVIHNQTKSFPRDAASESQHCDRELGLKGEKRAGTFLTSKF